MITKRQMSLHKDKQACSLNHCLYKVSSLLVHVPWHFQLLTEGADHGCPFVHHSCGKPCSRRGMRVPRVLPKLWDPVHELGEYPLHSQQFSVCPAVMFLCCWAAKVCTFYFVTAWSKFVLDEWILMKWIIRDEHKLLKPWSCVCKMEVKLLTFLLLVLDVVKN